MADLKNNTPSRRLTRAFRGAAQKLDTLQKLFLSAAGTDNRAAAVAALHRFGQAAQHLRISENAFNRRARPAQGAGQTLLKHLRTPEQFAAVRAFASAKLALLAINPDLARRIVSLTAAQDIAAAKPAAPKPARAAFRP